MLLSKLDLQDSQTIPTVVSPAEHTLLDDGNNQHRANRCSKGQFSFGSRDLPQACINCEDAAME